MPDPKTCAAKFKPGTKEYLDCVNYRTTAKGKSSPVKGSLKKTAAMTQGSGNTGSKGRSKGY